MRRVSPERVNGKRARWWRWSGAVVIFFMTLSLGAPASAHDDRDPDTGCMRVYGHYDSFTLPASQCSSAVGFCTAGTLTGSLRGNYSFVMDTLMPSPQATTPAVVYYTGSSLVQPKWGGSLVGTDNGVIDIGNTDKQAAMVTITDGADGLEGAHGYLLLRGNLNLANGETTGDYSGEICGIHAHRR